MRVAGAPQSPVGGGCESLHAPIAMTPRIDIRSRAESRFRKITSNENAGARSQTGDLVLREGPRGNPAVGDR
jgi:hypothetical protein